MKTLGFQTFLFIRSKLRGIKPSEIKHIDYKTLRALIALIPQDVNLFYGTIIENITLGESFPNMQRILNLCNQLKVTKFAEKFPNGFETYV